MKKNNVQGLVALLLWAVVLSFLVSMLKHGGSISGLEIGGVLRTAGIVLFLLAIAAVFFASKGRRLRMVLFLTAGAAAGILLAQLNLSAGMGMLVIMVVVALSILGCALFSYLRLRRAFRPLNEAVLAYQQDHDGEKFLAALDRCAPNFPKGTIIKRPDVGVVSIQEHIACERLEALGSMGRLEERRALIETLRREAKNGTFASWLDQKAAEFGIGQDDAPEDDTIK